ncbi:MAG: hypothetical protein QGG50_06415 [Methanopyri archaeon]|nr:hypothetical protein [Methanopyri archaeon]
MSSSDVKEGDGAASRPKVVLSDDAPSCTSPACPLCRRETLAFIILGFALVMTGQRDLMLAGYVIILVAYALAFLGIPLPDPFRTQPRAAPSVGSIGKGPEADE